MSDGRFPYRDSHRRAILIGAASGGVGGVVGVLFERQYGLTAWLIGLALIAALGPLIHRLRHRAKYKARPAGEPDDPRIGNSAGTERLEG